VVTLPAHHGQPAVTVTAILAREEHPPAGAKAIEWRRLTNRTAETLEQVVELIDWYRRHWLVEIFFRIWKSGCRIEALQLGALEPLERALVIYLIIAWRLLHLVTWGLDCPLCPVTWCSILRNGKPPGSSPTAVCRRKRLRPWARWCA
jgi:hypothetical protein